jgi:hypothetical protein
LKELDYDCVLNAAIVNDSTREWAVAEIERMLVANKRFWEHNPELIEELDSRHIPWDIEMHPGHLFERGSIFDIAEAFSAALKRVREPERIVNIVHQFKYARKPFDATALIEIFEGEGNDEGKRAIANFLPCSKAIDLLDWMIRVLNDPKYGVYRDEVASQTRCLRGKKRNIVLPVLIEHFFEYPAGAGAALATMGREEELLPLKDMLISRSQDLSAGHRHWLQHAIAGIEKRIGKKLSNSGGQRTKNSRSQSKP